MKNKALAALAALVLLFSGFTGGYFLGRNTRVAEIQTTKTVYETVPGETVIVMQEVLVTLPVITEPVETDPPDRSSPILSPAPKETAPKETKPKESKVSFPVNINTAVINTADSTVEEHKVIACIVNNFTDIVYIVA